MSKQTKVIGSAILGTTFMTLFSYLFSYLTRDNTKEPALLGKMIYRVSPGLTKKYSQVAGWAVHYAVGLLFAELYAKAWESSVITANTKTGLIFGGLSGIAAILIWKFTLAIHPFAPAMNFIRFAVNLFVAHLVFGLFAAVGYSW